MIPAPRPCTPGPAPATPTRPRSLGAPLRRRRTGDHCHVTVSNRHPSPSPRIRPQRRRCGPEKPPRTLVAVSPSSSSASAGARSPRGGRGVRRVGPGQARRRRPRRGQHPAITSAPMSGVSTRCSTAKSADPACRAEIPPAVMRSARCPVSGHHRAGRCGHVDHRGAQHHHDIVTPAGERRHRERSHSPCRQGLSACRSGSGAGGEQHAGRKRPARHANSVNLPDSGTMSAPVTTPKKKRVHPVDEVLPLPKLAAYGFQHVVAFYAGAVLVPILIASAIGLSGGRTRHAHHRRPVHLRRRLDHPGGRVQEVGCGCRCCRA